MSGRGLVTRLARLESKLVPRRRPRIVTRFIGPGSERFPQPTKEEMDDYGVITVRFVEACEGRPKTQCRRVPPGCKNVMNAATGWR